MLTQGLAVFRKDLKVDFKGVSPFLALGPVARAELGQDRQGGGLRGAPVSRKEGSERPFARECEKSRGDFAAFLRWFRSRFTSVLA